MSENFKKILQSNLDISNLNISNFLDISNFSLLTKILLHKKSQYKQFSNSLSLDISNFFTKLAHFFYLIWSPQEKKSKNLPISMTSWPQLAPTRARKCLIDLSRSWKMSSTLGSSRSATVRSKSLTTSSKGDQKSQKWGTFQIIFDEACFKGYLKRCCAFLKPSNVLFHQFVY